MIEVQKMSDTEKRIMEIVWRVDEYPVTASEVQQLAGDVKEWKHTTIATFLQNLCQKGILRVVKKGNTNLYYPRIDEKEYLHFETLSFLDQVHNGSIESFMSALCSKENKITLSENQVAEIRKMIDSL